jgi:hypothetical protein
MSEFVRRILVPDQWVINYADLLFRFVYLRLGDGSLAGDIVQETFLSAWRSRETSEDRVLTQSERFQLQLHLGVCSLCRKYLQQTSMIIRSVKQLIGSDTITMSEEKKKELNQMFNKKQP